MSRNPHDLIEAAAGMDATSDPTTLAPTVAQTLINLLPDRRGQLRGMGQLLDVVLSAFTALIDGVGFLYAQIVQFSSSSSSSTPLPARLVVASGGTLYSYPLVAPAAFPPTFNVSAVTTFAGLIAGKRVRMASFGQEMIIVQDANGYSNYRMQYSGVMTQLGLNTPIAGTALSSTLVTPSGAVNKTGDVQYCMTTVDSLGRESSPWNTPFTIHYGVGATQIARLHAVSPYTDSQVAGVNFYATAGGGSTFYQIASLSSPTTDFDDNLADAIVQAGNVMPAFGENDKPLPASLVAIHKNRVFLNQTGTNLLQISNAGSGTQFNSQGFRVDATGSLLNPNDGARLAVGSGQGDVLTGLVSFGSLLALWTQRGLFLLYGDDLTDFRITPIQTRGCVAPDSVARCDNAALYLGDDGVYALAGNFETVKISKPIEVFLEPLRATAGGRAVMEAAVGWYVQNRYHLALDDTEYVYDFDRQQWFLEQYPAAVGAPVISGVAPSSGLVGSTVTLTGSGFTGATGVTIGGVAGAFTVVSGTTITVTVPSMAMSGAITVTTPSGTGSTGSGAFAVVTP